MSDMTATPQRDGARLNDARLNDARRTGRVPDIDSVARLAGVSTATVSRALRGLPNVSPDTRAKVEAAAKELDYVVSPSASRLASGTTGSVGVVTPYIGRHYFAQVLAGAEGVLRDAGYDVLLFALPNDEARASFFQRMPLRRRVDGVLVITLPLLGEQVGQFAALGLPMATVGMPLDGVPNAGIDDVAGARTAVNHLVNLGHERIAMIGGGYSDLEPNRFTTPESRRRGYREALREAGVAHPAEYEVDGEYTVAGGERAMAELLSLPNPPTAVFAQSDRMAFGAIHAVRSLGLSCPQDVSVIGFDGLEMAAAMDLTTIAQPMPEQGAAAARLLLEATGGGHPGDVLLPTGLVLRSSTAAPGRRRPR